MWIRNAQLWGENTGTHTKDSVLERKGEKLCVAYPSEAAGLSLFVSVSVCISVSLFVSVHLSVSQSLSLSVSSVADLRSTAVHKMVGLVYLR